MIPSVVELETLIAAPLETVWSAVTNPDQLGRWFSDAAEIDLRPGGEGTLTFGSRATNEPATVRVLVESVEPPHRFAFRWDHPDGAQAREGNSLLVQFTLTAEDDDTRVRVVESGFHTLEQSEAEKAESAEVHAKGWDIHVANLRDHVEGRR
ncbi:MAG TPA: SRPBCC domain-containing protein [Actinomycetes bacterium]